MFFGNLNLPIKLVTILPNIYIIENIENKNI